MPIFVFFSLCKSKLLLLASFVLHPFIFILIVIISTTTVSSSWTWGKCFFLQLLLSILICQSDITIIDGFQVYNIANSNSNSNSNNNNNNNNNDFYYHNHNHFIMSSSNPNPSQRFNTISSSRTSISSLSCFNNINKNKKMKIKFKNRNDDDHHHHHHHCFKSKMMKYNNDNDNDNISIDIESLKKSIRARKKKKKDIDGKDGKADTTTTSIIDKNYSKSRDSFDGILIPTIAIEPSSTSSLSNNKNNNKDDGDSSSSSSSSGYSYFKSRIFPTSLDSFSGLNNQNYLTSRDSFEGIDNYNSYRPSSMEMEEEEDKATGMEKKTSLLSSYLLSLKSRLKSSSSFIMKMKKYVDGSLIFFPIKFVIYHLYSIFHVYYSCFRLPREIDPTIEVIYGTFWTVVHRKGRVGEFELLWPYILGSVILVSERKHGNPNLNFINQNQNNMQMNNIQNYYQWKPIHKAIMINTFFTYCGYLIGLMNYKIFRITIPRNITPDVMLASYQILGSIFANIFFKVNPSKDYQQQQGKNSYLLNTNNYDFKI